MTNLKKRRYNNMGACPTCGSKDLFIWSRGAPGYFSPGDEVDCSCCYAAGVIVEKVDGQQLYCAVQWEEEHEQDKV